MATGGGVLYAEDDENDAFFMQRAFARLSRREDLHVVSNGRQAVDYLSERATGSLPRPGLVILDIKMPEMSGLEVLQWLRERPEFATLPVVMFTSSTQDKDVEFCRKRAANAYVVKPSNADNLAPLIERILAIAASGQNGRFNLPENQL